MTVQFLPSASAEPLRFRAPAAGLPDGVLSGGFGGVRVLVYRRCPSGQAAGVGRSAALRLVGRVRFHESLVEASGNAFFIDTIRNTPASTSTSSTCSRASATKRPRT
ncbi:hypothethical protein (plasmid) [Ralstonia solanacearum CMR15]|nr:hypothethical protein [Ralstonia solanacearum CMR15]